MPADNSSLFVTIARYWHDLTTGNFLVLQGICFVAAWFTMLVIGRPMIAWLRAKRWRKDAESWNVREDTPDTHQAKQGTPSMGGIGLIGSALASVVALLLVQMASQALVRPNTIVSNLPACAVVLFVLLIVGLHALLGFIDDWSSASGRGGLRARAKLVFQVLLAASFLILWWWVTDGGLHIGEYTSQLRDMPAVEFIVLWLVLGLIIVGTSNAVNLTDGVDGLAAGLSVVSFLALCGADFQPRAFWPSLGNIMAVALAGSCLGFLAFNRHKARVFMGDTGSLALGAGLALVAICLNAVLLLPFVGFMFFVDLFSVTLQVGWFKLTKRTRGEGQRIFRRAPLHHHFELCGWSEWRVVLVFWSVNLLTSALGLVLWHMKIIPRWPIG